MPDQSFMCLTCRAPSSINFYFSPGYTGDIDTICKLCRKHLIFKNVYCKVCNYVRVLMPQSDGSYQCSNCNNFTYPTPPKPNIKTKTVFTRLLESINRPKDTLRDPYRQCTNCGVDSLWYTVVKGGLNVSCALCTQQKVIKL